MPSCISCGSHYKISKDYDDPLECTNCVETLFDNSSLDNSQEDNLEYDLFHEGCSRTLPKFYDE